MEKKIYPVSLYKHSDITEQVLAAFYAVYSALGYGFLEKVYVNALKIELERRGFKIAEGFEIKVYYADLIVADSVIVEVKTTRVLAQEHEAQLLNYLKATPYEVGLLLNFGPKPEQKRRSFDNNRKEGWLAQHQS
ncbi:MAG: GxxExxY protein [Chloroflexi bacterium]|nr:MAG: GxxExxY protein [Chloroflexota bacterium]